MMAAASWAGLRMLSSIVKSSQRLHLGPLHHHSAPRLSSWACLFCWLHILMSLYWLYQIHLATQFPELCYAWLLHLAGPSFLHCVHCVLFPTIPLLPLLSSLLMFLHSLPWFKSRSLCFRSAVSAFLFPSCSLAWVIVEEPGYDSSLLSSAGWISNPVPFSYTLCDLSQFISLFSVLMTFQINIHTLYSPRIMMRYKWANIYKVLSLAPDPWELLT